jgi:hypothetical protein
VGARRGWGVGGSSCGDVSQNRRIWAWLSLTEAEGRTQISSRSTSASTLNPKTTIGDLSCTGCNVRVAGGPESSPGSRGGVEEYSADAGFGHAAMGSEERAGFGGEWGRDAV